MMAKAIETGEFYELVSHIHPRLLELDYSNTTTQVVIVLLSAAFYTCIFLTSIFLSSLIPHYRVLNIKEKVFWHLAVVRATFGIFATVVGVWTIWVGQEVLLRDIALGTTCTTWLALMVAVGFFTFECATLLAADFCFGKASKLLNLHHWLALTGFVMVLRFQGSHYFACVGLVLEMSTPYSCLCWIGIKCKIHNTLLWKANQFWLVHTFHLRSVVECFLWLQTWRHWGRIWQALPTPIFVSLYLQLILVTFVMTPYWTYKKTGQLITPRDWNFEPAEQTELNGRATKIE